MTLIVLPTGFALQDEGVLILGENERPFTLEEVEAMFDAADNQEQRNSKG